MANGEGMYPTSLSGPTSDLTQGGQFFRDTTEHRDLGNLCSQTMWKSQYPRDVFLKARSTHCSPRVQQNLHPNQFWSSWHPFIIGGTIPPEEKHLTTGCSTQSWHDCINRSTWIDDLSEYLDYDHMIYHVGWHWSSCMSWLLRSFRECHHPMLEFFYLNWNFSYALITEECKITGWNRTFERLEMSESTVRTRVPEVHSVNHILTYKSH